MQDVRDVKAGLAWHGWTLAFFQGHGNGQLANNVPQALYKWTQKELAAKLDMHFAQLNKYEGGLHAPPLDKIVELAEIFDTTVDYLLTGNRTDERPLHNLRLLERFKELEEVNAGDQETVIKLIDAMIVKSKVEGAIKPLQKRAEA